MTVYCQGAKNATVTITSPNQEKIVSSNPAISVEILSRDSGSYIDYTHDMSSPMDRDFGKLITNVELNDPADDWIFSKDSKEHPISDPIVHSKCPTLNEAHLFDTLHINGSRLTSNFDSYYPDNLGTCTYRVYFGYFNLTITDSTGLIYSHNFASNPIYQVSCDSDCPPGCCKIDCPEYPGYCCISESLIDSLINKLKKWLIVPRLKPY